MVLDSTPSASWWGTLHVEATRRQLVQTIFAGMNIAEDHQAITPEQHEVKLKQLVATALELKATQVNMATFAHELGDRSSAVTTLASWSRQQCVFSVSDYDMLIQHFRTSARLADRLRSEPAAAVQMPTGTPAGFLASITLAVNETLLNEGGIGADMVAGESAVAAVVGVDEDCDAVLDPAYVVDKAFSQQRAYLLPDNSKDESSVRLAATRIVSEALSSMVDPQGDIHLLEMHDMMPMTVGEETKDGNGILTLSGYTVANGLTLYPLTVKPALCNSRTKLVISQGAVLRDLIVDQLDEVAYLSAKECGGNELSQFNFSSAGKSKGHAFGFAVGRLNTNYCLLWFIPSAGACTAYNAFAVDNFIFCATNGANFVRKGRGLNLPPIELDYETNPLKCIGSGVKKHFEKAKALIGVVDQPGYKSSSVIGGEIISP